MFFGCFVMSVSQRDPSMVAPSVDACDNISTSFFRTCIFHPCIIVPDFSILAYSTPRYLIFPYLHFHFSHAPAKQLKYIEPVVDGSRSRQCAVQWANRNKLKVQTKLNKTTTTNNWKVAPRGRGATPYIDCRWSTRIQMGLSVNHTPEYLRGRGPDNRFKKYVPCSLEQYGKKSSFICKRAQLNSFSCS